MRTGIALFYFDKVSFMKHPNGYLVEKHGIALAAIDPIGTGFQGAEKMFRLP